MGRLEGRKKKKKKERITCKISKCPLFFLVSPFGPHLSISFHSLVGASPPSVIKSGRALYLYWEGASVQGLALSTQQHILLPITHSRRRANSGNVPGKQASVHINLLYPYPYLSYLTLPYLRLSSIQPNTTQLRLEQDRSVKVRPTYRKEGSGR